MHVNIGEFLFFPVH